jgi:SAM-dependent methyltransferase
VTTLDQLRWRCIVCKQSSLAVKSALIKCLDCGKQYFLSNGVWECATGFLPSCFSQSRSQHLLAIEQDHFWFSARDRLLRTKLLALKRPEDRRLLELGCGSGRVLATLAKHFNLSVGVEGHQNSLQRANKSCQGSYLLHANVLDTPLLGEQFDWVVAFDVLEHVQAQAFLNEAYRLTRPGGRLLLSVPAFPMLWSHTDELAGHRCRYRWRQLADELSAAGWRLGGHTYYQCLLFPLLAVSRWLNRNTQARLERSPPASINRLLGACNQLEVQLCHRLTLPFGSSLIAWADKPVKPLN